MDLAIVYAVVSVLIVSLVSLVGILALSFNTHFLNKSLSFLVSLAVGALFGDAIIHLIPEAFEMSGSPETVSLFILLGIFSFLILEKFLHWRHVHNANHIHEIDTSDPSEVAKHNIKPVGVLVIVSDGIHNLLDGIIIGASYFVSIEVGIATTIAILLHEIPQEIGDFGLLMHAGFTKIRALLVNFLSALTSVFGVALAIIVGSSGAEFIPLATAFAAGSFLYIAGSDLVPELNKVSDLKRSFVQLIAILIGVSVMWVLLFI